MAGTKLKRRKAGLSGKRIIAQALAGLIALGLAWMIYVQWTIEAVQPSAEPLLRTDVGIVLGAALRDGKPSPALKERLDLAIEAYVNGAFPAIIVTGGRDYPSAPKTEAEGMRDYLVEQGVPADRVVTENYATSTFENLLYSQAIMRANGWDAATIVTHDYHGARSLDIARYLDYDAPQLAVTESRVMNMAANRTREALAYGKWSLDKWMLETGMKDKALPVFYERQMPGEES